jgi:hypothetical protein
MKKLLLSGLLLLGILADLSSQTADSDGEPRAVKEGDNSVNFYYGTNLLTTIYKRAASSTAENVKFKSLGPIGIVYEHLLTDVIGLGVEFGYSKTTVEYRDSYYNSSLLYQTNEIYEYQLTATTIRAMFRANFHFAKSEKFDAYGLISVGYRSTKFNFTSTNPYDNGSYDFNSLIPVGVKPGLGFRYFFIPNVGINLEIAAGTPLMCGGLSFKF